MDNTVFFVGDDLIVYGLTGYEPVKISTPIIESDLRSEISNDTFAYAYQDNGHVFYMLTILPLEITWCFDVTTKVWHKRKSYNHEGHVSNGTIFFDSKILTGDFVNNRIYHMNTEYNLDDGTPIVREFILPTITNNREYLSLASFELDMKTGIGDNQGQGYDPTIILQVSKDNGVTWSNEKFASIGKMGEYYTRVIWRRLGTGRQFTMKIKISDPIDINIGGAFIGYRG